MPERLYRTQILLQPEQHAALSEIARLESRSISEVVREILRDYLAKRDAELQLNREMAALGHLRQIRERAEQSYGVYQGDLMNEARGEDPS